MSGFTRIWQDVRKPRVERIRRLARSTQGRYQAKESSPSGVVPEERQEEVEPSMEAEDTSMAFLKWQYGYDVVAEMQREVMRRTEG